MKRSPIKRKPLSEKKLAAQRANARKRVYKRTGTTKTCARPGCTETFYVTATNQARKFCSRQCMGKSRLVDRTRQCSVCGQDFQLPKLTGTLRKTCSRECWKEAGRRAKTGPRNPNYNGNRTQPTPEWKAVQASECPVCGSDRDPRRHHVVYEQHVRKYGGDHWNPDDCLVVCNGCHRKHHDGGDFRIHVRHLRPENLRFAASLLGDYAQDYFIRYYDGSRAEIAALIESATLPDAAPSAYAATTADGQSSVAVFVGCANRGRT